MTVRHRLFGSAVVFLAALAFVTSAHAQPGRDPTTDEVKARILEFLGRGGAGQFPPGMRPEAGGGGPEPRPRRPIGEPPPTGPDPGKGAQPVPDVKGKGGPDPVFKGDGPGNQPAQLPPTKQSPPEPGKKGGGPLDPQRRPEFVPPDQQPLPKDKEIELPSWEKPKTPQEMARQAVAGVWENNVGPLKETPAVEKALFDIVDGTGDLKDPDGNSLWETLSKEMGDGKGFGDLFNGLDGSGSDWNFGDSDWSFPKLNWNFNWGNNRPPDIGSLGPPRESWFSKWRRSPSSSSSSSPSWFSGWKAPRWNIGVPSLDGTWWPLLIVIAALVGGVFLWKWLAGRGRPDPYRIDPYALGPWPVDPHHLTTRQDVVVAFEHLSVLLCGPVAKTWTHTTIAEALSQVAMAEPQRALMLARLYELARYTPIEEPLTTAELAEARRLVCRLAGFTDD